MNHFEKLWVDGYIVNVYLILTSYNIDNFSFSFLLLHSGGHTTEMLRLMSGVEGKYYPRHFVVAKSDRISEKKIHSFENRRIVSSAAEKNVSICI